MTMESHHGRERKHSEGGHRGRERKHDEGKNTRQSEKTRQGRKRGRERKHGEGSARQREDTLAVEGGHTWRERLRWRWLSTATVVNDGELGHKTLEKIVGRDGDIAGNGRE
ncbi:hypothetical protein Adt_43148 [Abeliophyllum distichum]|uniref:Uncharacterized protein n=1 Tax=Abeliophyllum distichum TaxID=126358 RepID=A0ABD1PTP1_9LAMI